ncbi:hypothetical protein V6N13_078595 [Hibiscus sabdariffa]
MPFWRSKMVKNKDGVEPDRQAEGLGRCRSNDGGWASAPGSMMENGKRYEVQHESFVKKEHETKITL